MTAIRLDGKATAAAIKTELTVRVAALRASGVVPGLATVLVGRRIGTPAMMRRITSGLPLRDACHAAVVDALTDDADTLQALDEVVRAVIGDGDA